MRAADDFAVIRARMEELQRERREPEYRTARTGTGTIGASDPRAVQEIKDRVMERNRLWIAQRR